jgi:CheY-like chemotaxis protein
MIHDAQSCAGSPRHILVVEDDVFLRESAAEFLTECGYPVVQAETADEAVAILTTDGATDERIGVVFSDVNMPGELDGIDLAQWVARERSDVRVILASGKAQLVVPQGRFFSKPYEMIEVERAVRELSPRRTAAQSV